MKITPTKEQQAIVDAVPTLPLLKVDAVAGSGKTSVLKMIAAQYPHLSFLYLAYNKAMQLDAEKRMPSNVECRTTHSIAYQAVGRKYQHKLKRPQGGYVNVGGTGSEIAKLFNIRPHFDKEDNLIISSSALGNLVKNTVNRFEHTEDSSITEKNIPENDVRIAMHLTLAQWKDKRFRGNISRVKNDILKWALVLWEKRKDVKCDVLITHDTYLKLYQLSKPILDCDVLLVDEAQDANPCFISIVKNNFNKCKCVVFVGDEHQAIYQWRGSTNAMKMFDCPVFKLSQSFRYGEAVADIAERILEGGKRVKGLSSIPSVVSSEVDSGADEDTPHTILFRTNFELVQTALHYIANTEKTVNIETDVKDLCSMLQSANALYNGDKKGVKHDTIIPFDTWYDLVQEVEDSGDVSMGRVAKWVESGNVHSILHCLNTHKNVERPDVVLTTAHKSKGLEWKNVVLADDFPSPYNKDGVWVGLNETEQNLLYVACTRASHHLYTNKTVEQFLQRSVGSGGGNGMSMNVSIYSANEYLNNPHLQLPNGETAAEHFALACEELASGEWVNDEDADYEAAEGMAKFVEKLTGVNPMLMPDVESLEREFNVLYNTL